MPGNRNGFFEALPIICLMESATLQLIVSKILRLGK